MIRVFFESPKHWCSEQVAVFRDEETYNACVPALEKMAKANRMILTESVTDEELDEVTA